MAYSVLIYRESEAVEELPFSSHQFYADVWSRLVSEIGLPIISQIECGIYLNKGTFGGFLEELLRVKLYTHTPNEILQRINDIESRLVEVQKENDYIKIFVG